MMPQAIRPPALPAGSVFMSSAFSWIMMDVPPLVKTELGAVGSRVTSLFIRVALTVPSAFTPGRLREPAAGLRLLHGPGSPMRDAET